MQLDKVLDLCSLFHKKAGSGDLLRFCQPELSCDSMIKIAPLPYVKHSTFPQSYSDFRLDLSPRNFRASINSLLL